MTKKFNNLLMTTVTVGALALNSHSAMAGMLWDKDDLSIEQVATVKVTMTEAIAKAKAEQSGAVIKAKLEKEDGKLVYEIKLLDSGKKMKIIVDALSGKVTTDKD